eukprot:TRINITY_DN30767_c0_g1_i1.p1 TRINITY_DN30767_c0_g1~~TRINITY_DN30767_c0_g1_i1.p1  ORF type:complete len:594 (-),score=141.02 TRINITY_DN30767_c0_g1_i1:195-1925(-)
MAERGTSSAIGRQTNEKGESLHALRQQFGKATLSLGDVTTVFVEQDEEKKSQKKQGQTKGKQADADGQLREGDQDASERSEDSASDSDSIDLEEEEDEEEDEEEEEEALSLHRLHKSPSSTQPDGLGPVRIPACASAAALANRAATDLKVRGTVGCMQVSCVLKNRSIVISEDMSAKDSRKEVVIPLLRSEMAPVEVGAGLATTIIAIVPEGAQGMDWLSKQARAAKAESGIHGWLFTCKNETAARILHKFSCSGAIRTVLSSTYHLFVQGKRGLGTFGCVVRAANTTTDRTVAVKCMRLQANVKSLFNEVEMLMLSQQHPNIVQFYGLWADPVDAENCQCGFKWYIVMDHFNGDLYDRVAEGRRVVEKECIPILHNVLTAITFLHGRGIFHRDIKPENMLLDMSSRIVLTDFGIACLVSNEVELKKTVGTVGYAAPEMLAGKAAGYQGDEFGAGVVLYFLLSKSTPFLAPTSALTIENTMACQVNLNYGCFDNISADCRKLILGFCQKDVATRLKAEDVLKSEYMRTYRGALTSPELPSLPFDGRRGEGYNESSKAAPLTMGNFKALREKGRPPT